MVDNKVVESGIHTVVEDGNLCIQYESDKVTCKDVLKVDVSGGVPREGSTITIIGGQIKKVNLIYETSTIMKNKKGELAFFQNEYEIGDEIVFNPGDGDRSWNVIDEDIDTVTLMLNENLAQKAWYAPETNNNYGPITALNYLNTFTTGWTNVEPLDNFVYLNNQKGTTLPYGYQKIEIQKGITKLTAKDGQENQIVGETKARLITFEEIMEIGQIFNENLKEENLRKYIERNLGTFNSLAETSFETVDEVINALVNAVGIHKNSKYIQTLIIVFSAMKQYNIEPTYDISMPEFIMQNNGSFGYWTLSTTDKGVRKITESGYLDSSSVEDYFYVRVRPVITIPKTKLK